jgi:hypothetical protein
MPVADVDHGSDTATATANPSAVRAKRAGPKWFAIERPVIVQTAAVVVAAAA